MSAENSIQSAGPGPCEECGHPWEDHTWQSPCLHVVGRDERGTVWCSCQVTKGFHRAFGLVLSKGRYVRRDNL